MGKVAVWKAGGGSPVDAALLGVAVASVSASPSYGNSYTEVLKSVDLSAYKTVFGVFTVNSVSAGATARASVNSVEVAFGSYGSSAGHRVLVFSVQAGGTVEVYRGTTLIATCPANAVPVRLFCNEASMGWYASSEFYCVE